MLISIIHPFLSLYTLFEKTTLSDVSSNARKCYPLPQKSLWCTDGLRYRKPFKYFDSNETFCFYYFFLNLPPQSSVIALKMTLTNWQNSWQSAVTTKDSNEKTFPLEWCKLRGRNSQWRVRLQWLNHYQHIC